MILNGVMAVILGYFTEFGSFGPNYVKVVEDRRIVSAEKCNLKNLVLALYYLWRYSQRLPKRANNCA